MNNFILFWSESPGRVESPSESSPLFPHHIDSDTRRKIGQLSLQCLRKFVDSLRANQLTFDPIDFECNQQD